AAATAALAPLPPPCWEKRPPLTVSPGAGRRSPTTTRSVLIEPTTMTRGRATRGSLGGRLLVAGEARARHHAPLAPAAQVADQPAQAPDGRHLAVAQPLEERDEQQPPAVAQAAVAAVGPLLEHERPRRQQQPEAVGDEQEEDRERDVDGAEQQPEHDRDDADELDDRSKQLDQEEVGEHEQADAAVARVEREPLVPA